MKSNITTNIREKKWNTVESAVVHTRWVRIQTQNKYGDCQYVQTKCKDWERGRKGDGERVWNGWLSCGAEQSIQGIQQRAVNLEPATDYKIAPITASDPSAGNEWAHAASTKSGSSNERRMWMRRQREKGREGRSRITKTATLTFR